MLCEGYNTGRITDRTQSRGRCRLFFCIGNSAMYHYEDDLTPQERLQQIAGILAAGILRLKASMRATEKPAECAQTANNLQNSDK